MTAPKLWSAALLAVTCVWGISFTLVHETLLQIASSTFVLWRFAIATVALAFCTALWKVTLREAAAG